jgi:hypothetical protein
VRNALNRNVLHAEIAPKRVGFVKIARVHDSAPSREKRDWREMVRAIDDTVILTQRTTRRSVKVFVAVVRLLR